MCLITTSRKVAPLVVSHIGPFFNCTYSMGLPFLLCHMYFIYIVDSSLTTFLAMVPSIIMWTHSFMSACRKTLGMSVTTIYLPSFGSIEHNIIIASSDTVGELASSLFMYCQCGIPSVDPLAFMVQSLYSLINIKYLRTFCLSPNDISLFPIGTIAFLSYNCRSFFVTA